MRRTFRIVMMALLVVVLVLAAAGGALAWRLSQGPLSLAPVAGLLGRLAARGTPYAISFADPALEWSRDQDAVYLNARDIEVRTVGGEFVASAPSAGVRIDAAALIQDRALVVRDVELRLPAMQLERDGDGQLTLSFDGRLASLPLANATGPGMLSDLGRGNEEAQDPRLQRLRRIRVSAAALRFRDAATGQTIETGSARLRMTREGEGWELLLAVTPAEPGSSLRVLARPGDQRDRRQVSIGMARVPLTIADGLFPELSLAGTDLRIDGRASLIVDVPRRALVGGDFSISSDGGTVAAAGRLAAPLALGPLQLDGAIDPQSAAVAVAPFKTTINGHPVELTPTISGPGTGSLALTSPGIDRDGVLALWPLTAARGGRAWFSDNVKTGKVTAFSLARRADGEVTLDGAAQEVDLVVLPAWPMATGVAGRLSFVERRLDVTLDRGALGELALQRGTLGLVDRPGGSTSLTADLSITGPVGSALEVLGKPPLRVQPGIRPAQTDGVVAADIRLALPKLRDVPRDEVHFTVTAQLDRLAIRDALGQHDITDGQLKLDVDQAGAAAKGTATLAGLPLEINWNERFEGKDERRRVVARGAVGPADLRALGLPWDGFGEGTAAVEATLVQPARGARRVEIRADLADAALDVPAIGLAKARGAPGTARATVIDDRPRRLAVEAIDIDLQAAVAKGAVELNPEGGGWRSVAVERLSWPRGALTAALENRAGAVVGTIDATRLDLRQLPARSPGGRGGSGATPVDLRLSVDELLLGSRPLTALKATLLRDTGRWRRVVADALLPGGKAVSLKLGAADAPDRLVAEAQDFGALLAALGLGDRAVEGGRARIDGTVRDSSTGSVVEGELKVRQFVIREAPAVARILSLASFQGISNTLGGRGLEIDRLTAPFSFADNVLQLRQARVVGSQIGGRVDGTIDLGTKALALEGTVAPLYTLNRILGRIPIIGDILRGDRSDAALAATFSVGGRFADPQISVNPLAAIVPGVIRDLFRDYGTPAEPPPG